MAGRALAVAEPLVLLAAAPLLLFPTYRPAWTVVALALLVVAFLSRARGAVGYAAIILVLVVVQVALGFLGHEMTSMALLHGLNALLLFGCAFAAARSVKSVHLEVPAHAEPVLA